MPALRVLGFDGLEPRTSASMLAVNKAQLADNVKLYSQELRPWRGPVHVQDAAGAQTIYKMYGPGGVTYWWLWSGSVDVAPGPLADPNTEARIYLTGNTGTTTTPRKTRYADHTLLPMGVPAPVSGPAVSTAGGVGTAETRAYVYTYIAQFGSIVEESGPSDPSTLINVLPGGSVTVTGFTAPPAGYNVTGRRIYRTVAGASTDSYEFVAEILLAAPSYVDSLLVADLGEALGTIGWAPPPDALQGLVAAAGGFLAGFVGNTVYFSEPFHPHAWPSAYAISLPFDIIGLGVFGSSIVVMTTRNPYVINGSAPGALSAERQPMDEPCISKLTIASDQDGVVYASPNGLIGIGSGFRGNVTRDLFTRDEWQALRPDLLHGAIYASQYFGIYPDFAGGKALVLNRGDKPALSRLDLFASAVHVDAREGQLYFVSSADGDIYKADADAINRLSYVWRSKRTVFPRETSFSVFRIDADFDQLQDIDQYNIDVAAIAAANANAWALPLNGALNTTALNVFDVNGSTLQNIPPVASTRSLQLLVYGDGDLKATMDVTSFDPVRLPAFRSRSFEFELAGNIDVRSAAFATTVGELVAE